MMASLASNVQVHFLSNLVLAQHQEVPLIAKNLMLPIIALNVPRDIQFHLMINNASKAILSTVGYTMLLSNKLVRRVKIVPISLNQPPVLVYLEQLLMQLSTRNTCHYLLIVLHTLMPSNVGDALLDNHIKLTQQMPV